MTGVNRLVSKASIIREFEAIMAEQFPDLERELRLLCGRINRGHDRGNRDHGDDVPKEGNREA